MPNIPPLPDSSTAHMDEKGKPKKDFTNWLKSVEDFVNKTAQSWKSLVLGSPTGGNKGDGSINAETIYIDGTELILGTAAGDLITWATGPKYPAGDGSLLTDLPNQAGRLTAGTALTLDPVAVGSTSQAHGLGIMPVLCDYVWECKTAEHGYAVGERVFVANSSLSTVSADATNVVLTVQAAPQFTDKTTHLNFNATLADWKAIITPYSLT